MQYLLLWKFSKKLWFLHFAIKMKNNNKTKQISYFESQPIPSLKTNPLMQRFIFFTCKRSISTSRSRPVWTHEFLRHQFLSEDLKTILDKAQNHMGRGRWWKWWRELAGDICEKQGFQIGILKRQKTFCILINKMHLVQILHVKMAGK